MQSLATEQTVKPGELKHIREGLALTQEAFAVALGVHRVTVAKWEAGDRGIPEPVARLAVRLRDEALMRDVHDARAALDRGERVLGLDAIADKVERRLGAGGRHHAQAIRSDDRTARGKVRIAAELTMVLDKLLRRRP